MKRTSMRILAVLLLAALLLSACSNPEPPASSEAGTTEQKETEQTIPVTTHGEEPAETVPTEPSDTEPVDDPVSPEPEVTFSAKFEGDQVSGTGEAVDGVYRVAASKTDQEAWHVKLEANYPTTPGRDYHVSYRFHSDVGGTIKFGDHQEFRIVPGDNTVTGLLSAVSDLSYLDLQLGMLKPFTMDFQEILVEELTDVAEYEDVMPQALRWNAPNTVTEQHDEGYEQRVDAAEDGATLHVAKAPQNGEIWQSRLFVRTGTTPEAGNRYRVCADVKATNAMDFEILYNNAETEKGYAARYGLHLNKGTTKTVEQILAIPAEGFEPKELVLQFALGKAPQGTDVTVSNVRVEKISDEYTSVLPSDFTLKSYVWNGTTYTTYTESNPVNVPLTSFSYSGTDSVYERHDEGYQLKLTETASSAELAIQKAPADAADRGVWKAKLYAETGVSLEAGKTYRIKFDLNSAKNQAEYEACFDGDSENAYGALYGRSLQAGKTDSVVYTVTPEKSGGPLTLRLQLGKTDSAAGNTVTLRNLSVETISASYQDAANVSYTTGVNVREEHGDGIEQSLEASGSSATLNVAKARSEGGVWSSRLFVHTGVTPETDAHYRVTVNMSGTKAIGDFEIVCDNGSAEAGYAKRTGLALPAGNAEFTCDFNTQASGCRELVLRFQLGNSPAGNSITINNIRIVKVTAKTEEVEMPGFAYPVTTDPVPEIIPAGYAAQNLSLNANTIAWDGSDLSASVSGETVNLTIARAHDEGIGGGWSSRLHVGTGVVLEQGAEYCVTAVLHSEKAIDNFELLYSNGNDEDDGFNPGGKGYNDGRYGLSVGENGDITVTHTFTVPERSQYRELVLRFQLGNSPAPNQISVSGISVEKWVPEHTVETGGSTEYNSFDLEANEGADATLTGDGSSASALVTVPGDDWHIKLYAKPGVTLEAGKTYEISLNVSGAAGCGVFYKRVGGDEDSFGMEPITAASQTVTHTVTPQIGGTLEILLKLGTVPANTKVTVKDIQIRQGTETEGDNQMKAELCAWAPVNFWAHEDYTASISNDASSASLSVASVPGSGREAWKIKLFVETGATLKKGTHYRISADVKATADLDYEICYNNAEHEKALGALYELKASASKKTVTYEVTAEEAADLILQFNLGLASQPCTVTVSNVKVEELKEGVGTNVLTDFRYDSVGSFSSVADDGYKVSLEKKQSSAVFRITKAPAVRNPWNVKLHVLTGFTPAKNKAYRVSFDIQAAKAQSVFEVFFDGAAEAAYGTHSQALKAGKQTVSYLIQPGASKGPLTIQIRPGKTNGTDGNTYTISNVKITAVTVSAKKNYNYDPAVTLWTHNTYKSTLSRKADSATVNIQKTPAEGMEPWKTKLFINTGVTLKAGEKYRISLDACADKETSFEICYNNGGEEKGLGAMYGLTAYPETRTCEYTVYAARDTRLIIQVSLGSCEAPNSFTVSRVKVEKAGALEKLSERGYDFEQ